MWIVLVALHLAVASGCNPFQYEKYEINEKGGGIENSNIKSARSKEKSFSTHCERAQKKEVKKGRHPSWNFLRAISIG